MIVLLITIDCIDCIITWPTFCVISVLIFVRNSGENFFFQSKHLAFLLESATGIFTFSFDNSEVEGLNCSKSLVCTVYCILIMSVPW